MSGLSLPPTAGAPGAQCRVAFSFLSLLCPGFLRDLERFKNILSTPTTPVVVSFQNVQWLQKRPQIFVKPLLLGGVHMAPFPLIDLFWSTPPRLYPSHFTPLLSVPKGHAYMHTSSLVQLFPPTHPPPPSPCCGRVRSTLLCVRPLLAHQFIWFIRFPI